jgi:hypothetical protein
LGSITAPSKPGNFVGFIVAEVYYLPKWKDSREREGGYDTHRRVVAKPLAYYEERHTDPKAAMVAAYRSGDYSMKAIAEYFGVHYSTVSRAIEDKERKGEVEE